MRTKSMVTCNYLDRTGLPEKGLVTRELDALGLNSTALCLCLSAALQEPIGGDAQGLTCRRVKGVGLQQV